MKKIKKAMPPDLSKSDLDTIEEVVSIDALRLQDAFIRVPADLARWTEKYAQSLRRALRTEATRKRVFAERFLDIKTTPIDGMKGPSEAVIKMKVETDDLYMEAVDNEIDAEVERMRTHGIVEAIRGKKDALISLGAHVRAEMGDSPRIRGEHRGAHDVERTRAGESNADDDD